ncbi:unnamed protein product [Lactuca virosa]|uniref:Uncharacterized protein n=1 Tax=Lactuca virosa TaxID=75947 RepID=A0AAU9LKL6_9ASTR|nr:unnamed protein product [Lactuca virosa]
MVFALNRFLIASSFEAVASNRTIVALSPFEAAANEVKDLGDTIEEKTYVINWDGALRIEKVVDETRSREKKVNKRKVKSVERNEQLEAMDVELDMNETVKSGQVNKTNLVGLLRDDVGQLKELEGKTLVLSTKEEPKFDEPEEKHLTGEFDKEKFEGFFVSFLGPLTLYLHG